MAQEKNSSPNRGGGFGPGGSMVSAFQRPKDTKKTVLRLLGYLRKRIWLLIIVMVLMLVSTVSTLAGSYMLKPLINNYILPGDFKGLAGGVLVLGLIYLAGVVAIFFQNRFMIRIANTTVNTIRRDLFDRLQDLPLRYFDSHTHGELMSRFTNDMDNVQMALEQSLVQLLSSIVMFVGTVVMMLVLSPILFAITAVVILVMFIASAKIGTRSRHYFQEQQKNLGIANGYIEEMVEGLKVVKAFNHEDAAKDQFVELNQKFQKSATSANIFAGIIMPIMVNLNNVSYAATAVFGGVLAVTRGFDIGSLAAFLQYSRYAGQPIMQITNQINVVLAAMAGAERIFEVMNEKPEVDRGTVVMVPATKDEEGCLQQAPQRTAETIWAWKSILADGTIQFIEVNGDVRFEDVVFGYQKDKPVLKNISLFAKPGQKIALVGSTGAGKTTITNLANRFYDIWQGKITYDGININEIKKDDLRRSLGMVLQDTHLFTGTVMENIRYGRLDATDEECIEAAKTASAHSFIRRLPQGYDTVITGDGANLSQGQKQLLAIARAAVADPPVMILDEATSSIDTRTERLIERGMDALMEGRTVFVIAHRLSTVRNSKAILVLEDGEIIERGDHEDLLTQEGRYYQLYTGQQILS